MSSSGLLPLRDFEPLDLPDPLRDDVGREVMPPLESVPDERVPHERDDVDLEEPPVDVVLIFSILNLRLPLPSVR